MYRLGVNFQQLDVNRPKCRVANMQRGGAACPPQGGAPNYFPNSFNGPTVLAFLWVLLNKFAGEFPWSRAL